MKSLAAILITLMTLAASPAFAQRSIGPSPDDAPATTAPKPPAAIAQLLTADGDLNPLEILAGAGSALPGATPTSDSGEPRSGLSTAVNILVVLTVVTLAPSIMLMCTCFMRILIVLGLLKQALGTSTVPPPQVITGLSLFMTLIVMTPTLDRINAEAITPYREGKITTYDELWAKSRQPVRDFMFDQIEATGNWGSVYTILDYRGKDVSTPENLTRADVDMVTLVPAFMLSELKTAFLMGFKVYLPFLVIDMVVSTMLISMSMMMLPPVLVSLPFKLLLFVLVDGWALVVGGLLRSFVTRGGADLALLGPPLWIT